MKKRLLITAFALAMLVSLFFAMPLSASAASYSSGHYTYTVSGSAATITKASADLDGDVTIPSTLDGYTVTTIGNSAFSNNTNLTSIVIPNTVTSIGRYAFSGCSGITSLSLGNNVASIGYEAFRGCTGLRSVTIPNSVTSISDYAFYGCSRVTSVKIGTGLTAIPNYCFYQCDALTSVSIGSNVTSIGNYAFYNCPSLKSITWGSALKTIGNSAFAYCKALTSVAIPNTVTSVGKWAFSACSGITSLTIGTKVTSIGYEAFRDCTALLSVNIPNSVTSIGDYAFYGCSRVTSVKIGTGLTAIPNYCFYRCDALTSVSIGSNVTSLGNYAFYNCPSLKSITWGSALKTIGPSAFAYCNALTSVAIPNTVTSVGKWAFIGCSGITSLTIGTKVTSIGYEAFRDCTGLTKVEIPQKVITIASYAFYGCSGITKVYLPTSLQTLDTYAFYNCNKLTDVYYEGTETDFGFLVINKYNTPITDAIANGRIHYLYHAYSVSGASGTYTVTAGSAKIYTRPYVTGDSTEVRTVTNGTSLTIVGKVTNYAGSLWYKLSDGNFIYSGNVALKSTTTYNPANVVAMSGTYTVTAGSANIWSKPYSTGDSKLVRSAAKGTDLTVTGKVTNSAGGLWYKLSDGNWVYSTNVAKKATTYREVDVVPCSGIYAISSEGANIWSLPYSSGTSKVVASYKKGTQLAIVAKVVNSAGSTWIQLSEGGWVYFGNVTRKTAITYNPESVVPVSGTYTVTSWGANVWSNPFTVGNTKVVRSVSKDAALTIVGRVANSAGDTWYELSDGNWIFSGNVTRKSAITYEKVNVLPYNANFKVISWGANVWSNPYTSGTSKVVKTVAKDATLKVIGKVTNSAGDIWYQLSDGWIYGKNVVRK